MNPTAAKTAQPKEKVPGLRISTKLILTFLGFITLLGILLVFTYQKYVPPLVNEQIAQRTYAISQSFSSAVLESVLTRNYLRVNKIAELTAKLPDIAYVAVINKKGIAIAGQFSDLNRFSSEFSALIKEKGFPKDVIGLNRLTEGQKESRKELVVGGQRVFEIALPLGESDAEAHIGIFTENIEKALRNTLYPLLILLAVMGVAGTGAVALIAKTVSVPIRQLTEQAHAISTGKITQSIDIKCGGEIWELSRSFSRMQTSIKYIMEQLRVKKQGDAMAQRSQQTPTQNQE
jgi:methyl-accepting chemotaxis protein